ncbi:predicted protein [Nematostella vectensis]|uniref:Uncharacterized protein n=1 Tax=Nematostella vectensis TaxID=45351 RepID=A7SUD9_NEMVE|nr:predicted protein [Nematostella vectensis]|eukprot:XP_001624759.1 predicted protein [Nematostella vectensis]
MVMPSADHFGVLKEFWDGIIPDTVEALKVDSRFPATPSVSVSIADFEDSGGRGNNYGQRLTAYFVAPETGNYTFYMSCDDQCELSISTDHHVINARKIIWIASWTGFRNRLHKGTSYSRIQSRDINKQSRPIHFILSRNHVIVSAYLRVHSRHCHMIVFAYLSIPDIFTCALTSQSQADTSPFLSVPFRFGAKQKSQPIDLSEGSIYYLQALMAQGRGNDHLSVGARFPDGLYVRPLTSKYLIRYKPDERYGAASPGAWGEWSACSATCGDGTQSRDRTCIAPPPIYIKTRLNGVDSRKCLGIRACPVPPSRITPGKSTSSSVIISWQPVTYENPDIRVRGYNVTYIILPIFPASSRNRRAVSHVVSSPEAGHVIVSADVHSVVLLGLRAHRDYCVRVATLTSDGQSMTSSCVNVTTEQTAPSAAPTGLSAVNKTSPHKVSVQWGPVPLGDQNGVILGYYIQLYPVSTADKEPRSKDAITIRILDPEMGALVPGVQSYTVYSVRVAAFTAEGTGPFSKAIYVETCRCPKRFFTNWWTLPPLTTNTTAPALPEGSFPRFLNTFIAHACGKCHNHRETVIEYITSNIQSHQPSQYDVRKSIRKFADLSFPLTEPEGEVGQDDDHVFVPVFKMMSSIVYFRRKLSGEVFARMVGSSVFQCWPLVLLIIVLSILLSHITCVIWFMDFRYNEAQFPSSFLRGALEGTWCAFISMTTVGYGDLFRNDLVYTYNQMSSLKYGDRYAVSFQARLFAIAWVLVGLVTMSFFVATVASSLTVQIVIMTKFPESSGKVGVLEGSIEVRIAAKINGTKGTNVIAFRTQDELVKNLTEGDLDGVLIDALGATRTDLPLPLTGYKQVKTYDLTYHYGVYLAGDAAKLEHLMIEYLVENPFVVEEPAYVLNTSESENKGDLDGVLIDALGATRTDLPLPLTDYKQVKTYDLTYHYGVYLAGDAAKLEHLMIEYLVENPFVVEEPAYVLNTSESENKTESVAKAAEVVHINFFDPSNSMYVMSVRVTLGALIGAVLCGLIYTCYRDGRCTGTHRGYQKASCGHRMTAKEMRVELQKVLETFYQNCQNVQRRLKAKHELERKLWIHYARTKDTLNDVQSTQC